MQDDRAISEVSSSEVSSARLTEALNDLRATLLPETGPEPSPILQAAFRDGLGDTPPLAAPAPWRPARRRRVMAAGIAATLVLGGAGVAQALPGPAQSAFDWTADVVGLDPRDDQPAPPAGPVEIDPPDDTPVDLEGPAPQDGVADDVVPDATDPAASGVDDPASLSEDARDQAPVTPPTEPPVPVPAPAPRADGGTRADTTPAGGSPPADQIDPGRPGAGDEGGAPPTGGAP